jgi:hypothetical protein
VTDLHPHQLHALAAAWSLHDARGRLGAAMARERAAIAEATAESVTIAAASVLQAWRPMVGRGGSGGHGDPVGRSAVDVLEPFVRTGPLARLAARTGDTMRWLADKLRAGGRELDALDRIRFAVPAMVPWSAEQVTLWLAEADRRIRGAVHAEPAEHVVAGLACPSCGTRRLVALTAGPVVSVVCRAGCTCAGDGCPCGMPVTAVGVGHIWSAGSAVADRARVVLAA